MRRFRPSSVTWGVSILLVSLCLATLGSSEEVDLGSIPVDQLEDTRVCDLGTACSFSCDVQLSGKEAAVTAHGSARKYSARQQFSLQFEVTSECGSTANLYFRLDVTEVKGGDFFSTEEIRKYPVFFTQDRTTGKVMSVFSSKNDKKAVRKIKLGLVSSVAKKVHSGALVPRASHETTAPVHYAYQSSDSDGKFEGRHFLTPEADGGFVLVEWATYDRSDVVEGASLKQTRRSTANIDSEGRVTSLTEQRSFSVGTLQQMLHPAVNAVPSAGKFKVKLETTVTRGAHKPTGTSCSGPQFDLIEFADYANHHLDGAVSREFDAPFTAEDLEDAADPQDIQALLSRAEVLLKNGEFDPILHRDLLRDETVAHIAAYAMQLFAAGSLQTSQMATVVTSLGSVRTASAYAALSSALKNTALPAAVRLAAATALLPNSEELADVAPAAAIAEVAEVAFSQGDADVIERATLVLGALLRHSHVAAATHTPRLVAALRAAEGQRAETLLRALGNAGQVSSLSAVTAFLTADAPELRAAAVDALRFATLNAEAANALTAAVHDADPQVAAAARSVSSRQGMNLLVPQGDDKTLVRRQWNLSGDKNGNLVSAAELRLKWETEDRQVLAESALRTQLLRSKLALLSATVSGKWQAGVVASALDVKMLGYTVASRLQVTEQVVAGGKCPTLLANPSAATVAEVSVLSKTHAVPLAPVSFGLTTVTLSLASDMSMGVRALLQAHTGCTTASGSADDAFLVGVLPHGELAYSVDTKISSFLTDLGMRARVALLDGDLETYVIASNNATSAHVDSTTAPLSGSVEVTGRVRPFTEKAVSLVDWTGVESVSQLFGSRADAGVHAIAAGERHGCTRAGVRGSAVLSEQGLYCDLSPEAKEEAQEAWKEEGNDGLNLLLEYGGLPNPHNVAADVQSGVAAPDLVLTGKLRIVEHHHHHHHYHPPTPKHLRMPATVSQVVSSATNSRHELRSEAEESEEEMKSAAAKTATATGAKTMGVAQKAGTRERDSARAASHRVEKADEALAQSDANLIRRTSDRAKEQDRRTRKEMRQDFEKTQAEMRREEQEMKREERDKQIDGETREETRADSRLRAKLDRDAQRKQFRNLRKRERHDRHKVKTTMRRQRMKNILRRGLSGVQKMADRGFKRITRRGKYSKLRRTVRRDTKTARTERRSARRIERDMSRRSRMSRERRALSRADRATKKAVGFKGRFRRGFARIGARLGKLGRGARKAAHRLSRSMKKRSRRVRARRAERRKFRSLRRQERRATKKPSMLSRLRRGLGRRFSAARRAGRRAFKGIRKVFTRAQAKARSAKRWLSMSAKERRLARRTRRSTRRSASKVRRSINRGRTARNERRSFSRFGRALRKARSAGRRLARRTRHAVRRKLRSGRAALGRMASKGASILRRGVHRVNSAARRTAKGLGRVFGRMGKRARRPRHRHSQRARRIAARRRARSRSYRRRLRAIRGERLRSLTPRRRRRHRRHHRARRARPVVVRVPGGGRRRGGRRGGLRRRRRRTFNTNGFAAAEKALKQADAQHARLQQQWNKERDAIAKRVDGADAREGNAMLTKAERVEAAAKKNEEDYKQDLHAAEQRYGKAYGFAKRFEKLDMQAKHQVERSKHDWSTFQRFGVRASHLFTNLKGVGSSFDREKAEADHFAHESEEAFGKVRKTGKRVKNTGLAVKQQVHEATTHEQRMEAMKARVDGPKRKGKGSNRRNPGVAPQGFKPAF
mmetsp:Transcript_14745/g.34523  ORF Transcript_14745/g.34523 Transcript_14745/m.34523 type:complete len:1736 (+) Transcript_14745:3-5210(+)